MLYFSTNNPSNTANLKHAVLKGLADDGGLYMPERFPALEKDFFEQLHGKSLHEIAYAVLSGFLEDEIPGKKLKEMVEDTLDFDIPLVRLDSGTYSLELFHGPTMAFKDVGARFMARLMAWLLAKNEKTLKVVTATSGDTGSAVAAGFLNVPGIEVFVFFPKGKVSQLQQKQITTQGGNIKAIEIDGTFDDCQKLVKQILSDHELNKRFMITSANSINIARLLPQSIYYFYAASQLKSGKPLVFSVPSGNFGNLTAGLMAQIMGLEVERFVAATNVNDVVPEYFKTSVYNPRTSVQTLSNAMDVGNPSNFARILEMADKEHRIFCQWIYACSFTDKQTREAIHKLNTEYAYLMDPHGAVAWLGAKEYQKTLNKEADIVVLETAHPAKFPETLKIYLDTYKKLPDQLEQVKNKEEHFISMPNQYNEVKEWMTRLDS